MQTCFQRDMQRFPKVIALLGQQLVAAKCCGVGVQLKGLESKVCSAKHLRAITTRSRPIYTDDCTDAVAGPVYDRLTDDEETFALGCFVSSETLLVV